MSKHGNNEDIQKKTTLKIIIHSVKKKLFSKSKDVNRDQGQFAPDL